MKNPLFIAYNDFVQKIFFWNFESKVSAESRRRFLLSSYNSCGTPLSSFWTFPIVYKRTEMACCLTPSYFASSFSVCAEFISNNSYNSSVSIFWGRPAHDSSSRLKSPWRNFWYHLLHVVWFTAFSSYAALQWLQQHFASDETRSGWKIDYALLLLPSWTLLIFELMCIRCQTVCQRF